MGVFYEFGFPAVETHEGYAARRRPDGSLASSSTHETREFSAYVAACDCGWHGDRDYPPTDQGEEEALAEWRTKHMHPRVPMLARKSALRHCRTVLRSYVDEALSGLPGDERLHALVAVASIGALREEAEFALAERVRAARKAGASWADVGEAVGISAEAAQSLYDERVFRG